MDDENKDDQPASDEPEREGPVPLDYRQRGIDPYKTKTPLGWQVFAGFAAWLCGLAFVVEAANNRAWGAPFVDQQNAAFCAIAVALVGVGGACDLASLAISVAWIFAGVAYRVWANVFGAGWNSAHDLRTCIATPLIQRDPDAAK